MFSLLYFVFRNVSVPVRTPARLVIEGLRQLALAFDVSLATASDWLVEGRMVIAASKGGVGSLVLS